jgi:lysophospholipid acyltransferase (LPLAT)-like uncharacterized protein
VGQPVPAHYDTRPPQLSFSRRAQIPIIAAATLTLLRTLGPTLRFDVVGWPNAERVHASGRRCILAFWHRGILAATWWWRHRGIVVMNSTNFDGQWTRRVIESVGFGTAQGSSTRGGLRGLAVMARKIDQGHDAAFTIDGPRGPRYVAKPGPVLLARRTGAPIVCFHVHPEHAHTFKKSWDLFQVPCPFSRVALVIGPPIEVPSDANRETVEGKHAEMQKMLEGVRDAADSWFTLSDSERQRERMRWEFGDASF